MNIQASRSQMDQGELISYETNLVACYEAEYLLSLQYKTNCHCSDQYSATSYPNHTETMECNSWEKATEIRMESRKGKTKMEGNVSENMNSRKRPRHDANSISYIHSNSCKTNITEQQSSDSGVNCSSWPWCSNNINGYKEHINNSLAITGRLSPHVKRMCFDAQQCQNYSAR